MKGPKHILVKFSFLFSLLVLFTSQIVAQKNILLIISDDIGVDATNGYHDLEIQLTTPTLDSLRQEGISFENVFSTPVCGSTRATIMTGKHGIKTGMLANGTLSTDHRSIFKAIAEETDDAYANAVIGKWHIGPNGNLNHPQEHGVEYYTGLFQGAPSDYFSWNRVVDGVSQLEENYLTEVLTELSINWIEQQSKPWFLWLAHSAAHSPYHTPPDHMHTLQNTTNNYRKFLAMQESIDYSINAILKSMSQAQRENTVVIYIGDNGTPNSLLRDYPDGHGKGTLYQGGIRVPMIISGPGVLRKGEREDALVHLTDLHATILEIVGAELPGGIFNSLSFKNLLEGEEQEERDYNYSEYENANGYLYCIRNQQYKLLVHSGGVQEFYDLTNDSLEFENLMEDFMLTAAQSSAKEDLEIEAMTRQNGWSCRDHIQNGDEEGIDCGGSNCAPCIVSNENIDSKDLLTIYPNPSISSFNVSAFEKLTAMSIITMDGKIVKKFDGLNQAKVEVLLEGIPQGMLIVECQFKNFKIRKRLFHLK